MVPILDLGVNREAETVPGGINIAEVDQVDECDRDFSADHVVSQVEGFQRG